MTIRGNQIWLEKLWIATRDLGLFLPQVCGPWMLFAWCAVHLRDGVNAGLRRKTAELLDFRGLRQYWLRARREGAVARQVQCAAFALGRFERRVGQQQCCLDLSRQRAAVGGSGASRDLSKQG